MCMLAARQYGRYAIRRSSSGPSDLLPGTTLSRAGCEDAEHGAIVPPIHFATAYERDGDGRLGEYNYSRLGNPTRALFERAIAEAEGGRTGYAFSSGMAASSALLLSDPHSHILLPKDLYHGNLILIKEIMPWLTFETVDYTSLSDFDQSLKQVSASGRRIVLWLGNTAAFFQRL